MKKPGQNWIKAEAKRIDIRLKPKAEGDRQKVTTSDSLAKGVTESIPTKHELRTRPSE